MQQSGFSVIYLAIGIAIAVAGSGRWNERTGALRVATTLGAAPGARNPGMEHTMEATAGDGIVSKRSGRSIEQTVDRVKALLEAKGITLFAVIDHSGEAEKVGMRLRPTKLLVFGSPRAGTPLMTAAPSVAIDLPLKVLVWEGSDGTVWLSYNAPTYLAARHHLPPELMAPLAAVETLVAAAAQ